MSFQVDATCVICGGRAIQSHHVIFRSRWKDGVNEPKNVVSVCASCHSKLHLHQAEVPPYYVDRAREAYNDWLRLQRGDDKAPAVRKRHTPNAPRKYAELPEVKKPDRDQVSIFKAKKKAANALYHKNFYEHEKERKKLCKLAKRQKIKPPYISADR